MNWNGVERCGPDLILWNITAFFRRHEQNHDKLKEKWVVRPSLIAERYDTKHDYYPLGSNMRWNSGVNGSSRNSSSTSTSI